MYADAIAIAIKNQLRAKNTSLLQTFIGKSGWINLGENAAELIECETGEKLLTDWKLFRYCNDPFMIQCLETDCSSGKNEIS